MENLLVMQFYVCGFSRSERYGAKWSLQFNSLSRSFIELIKAIHVPPGSTWIVLMYFSVLQFNLTIDDEPGILAETKKVIDTKPGETILSRFPLCIEISLRTVDGDNMILEVWSLACNQQLADNTTKLTHSIYNRMGTLLKSLVLVTRSTPAYKLSRKQGSESFKIFYKIYSGNPNIHNLGEYFAPCALNRCDSIGYDLIRLIGLPLKQVKVSTSTSLVIWIPILVNSKWQSHIAPKWRSPQHKMAVPIRCCWRAITSMNWVRSIFDIT